MPLRDISLTLIVLGSLPLCFARPWMGILMFSWLGYMNLPSATWGIARSLQFSLIVAISTLAGFFVTNDRKPFVWTRESILIIALWVWFTVTSVFALYPAAAWWKWERVSKILLMALLTIPLFQDRHRIRVLLLVIAVSFGFYGSKEGLRVIATGGNHMVWGPSGNTAVSSNNDIALALNMCLPIFLYLAKEEPRRWLRLALWGTFVLSIVAVPFTFSRGGVLGLLAVLSVLCLGSRRKVLLVPLGLVAVCWFAAFGPQSVIDRMGTLQHYEQDSSAMGRLVAWGVGIKLASDHPLVGGGFEVFNNPETFIKYAPGFPGWCDAHSVYFGLLGEHGYVGLSLFAALIFFTFSTLRQLRRLGSQLEEESWISNYAQMLQAGTVGYLVTGAFVSQAYFDLAYQLLVLTVILRRLAAQELQAQAAREISDPVQLRSSRGRVARRVFVRPVADAARIRS